MPEPRSQVDGGGRGVLAFLFADIRGYTGFTASHGADAAAELVARFVDLATETVGSHGGRLRGTWGDEVLAEFGSARDAARAAVALQEQCVTVTLADADVPLVVGMGLDVGEASDSEEAGSASALNVAARLCSLAGPGEVLATRELVHLAGAVPGVTFEERGRARLKGVPGGRMPLVRLRSAGQDKARMADYRARVDQTPEHKRSRRRQRALVAALSAAALVVGLGTWSVARIRQVGPPTIPADSIGVVDADSGRLEATVTLPRGHHADAVVVGSTAAWLVDSQAGTVSRVDPDTRQFSQTTPVGDDPVAAVEHRGYLWVVNRGDSSVSQISLLNAQEVARPRVGKQPSAIAAGFGYLWVANRADNTVTRLDPKGEQPNLVIQVGDAPAGVAAGDRTVWVANSTDGTLSPIDPTSLSVGDPIAVGAGPQAVLATSAGVFVANHLELNVSRVDSGARRETERIRVGDSPSGLASAGDAVWVTNAGSGTLTRIDTDLARGTATWAIGSSPVALASDGSRLWVATRSFASAAHRGGTVTVAVGDDWAFSLDPARTVTFGAWAALRTVYDGLVGLRRASGAAGLELVPDLAVTLPRPTGGGMTYTFMLRQGITYSDGRPLRAGDVRRGLEREFTANTDPEAGLGAPYYYTGIVGGALCLSRPKTCSLAQGVITDDRTNTVTIRLTQPDPDFLYKLALPYASVVPAGAPMTDYGQRPYPGTGPYMISNLAQAPDSSEAAGLNLTLVRNPRFRQWSSVAQPDGYPDVIRWQPMTLAASYLAIDAGTADVMRIVPRPGETTTTATEARLRVQYPERVHDRPLGWTMMVILNTSVPPFDHPKARQALAYALDREKLAGAWVIPSATCQLLPPDYPGYSPSCPYTSSPDESGAWRGANPDRGRQLAEESGTVGQSVVVASVGHPDGLAEELRGTLERLGYHASVRDPSDLPEYLNPKSTANITFDGWATDFPAASGYYFPILDCETGRYAKWSCDHHLDALAHEASTAQLDDPARAQQLWQQVYEQVAVQAAVIPYVYYARPYFVSERANANFQSSWLLDPLYDQMWVQ